MSSSRNTRRSRASNTVTRSAGALSKATDIAMAAPQVVAHRVTRMALAGPTPNARDRREFSTMVMEKQWALAQSCVAWNSAMLRWQIQWWSACLRGDYAGAASRMFTPLPLALAGEKAVAQALEPVRRKVVSNARRLAGTPLTTGSTAKKPRAKSAAKTATKSSSKPAAKSVTKAVAKVATKTAAKTAAKAVAKTAPKTAAKTATKRAAKTAASSTAKAATKTAAKKAVKKAVKATPKVASEAASKS